MVDFWMENRAVKFTKGNGVNLKINGSNMSKVSGLVFYLRVPLHVSQTFLCSTVFSCCVGTSVVGREGNLPSRNDMK